LSWGPGVRARAEYILPIFCLVSVCLRTWAKHDGTCMHIHRKKKMYLQFHFSLSQNQNLRIYFKLTSFVQYTYLHILTNFTIHLTISSYHLQKKYIFNLICLDHLGTCDHILIYFSERGMSWTCSYGGMLERSYNVTFPSSLYHCMHMLSLGIKNS